MTFEYQTSDGPEELDYSDITWNFNYCGVKSYPFNDYRGKFINGSDIPDDWLQFSSTEPKI